jgi:hypothetical protein
MVGVQSSAAAASKIELHTAAAKTNKASGARLPVAVLSFT